METFGSKIYFLSLVFARWLLQRGCTGSRNFLDAFRKAVENEEEKAHGIGKITTLYKAAATRAICVGISCLILVFIFFALQKLKGFM